MTFRTALFLLILGGGSALLLLVNSGWREDPDNTETHAGSGLPPTSLNEDDRALLWDIEHHANVLSKYGWSKVCAALMEGDRTSLGSLLHKDLEVAFPENRLENSAPSQWAAVSRLTGTDGIRDLLPESGDRQIARDPVPAGETPEAKNASTSGADADVAEGTGSDTARRSTHSAPSVPSARLTGCLLNLRDEFVDAPRVNVEQVGISPNDPANFDGTWNSRFRLRFRGRTSSEEMRETVVRCFLRTRRPTESILSAGEWILEWRVISVDSVISPQPLMADVTQASGLKTETLFDNWDQPKGQRMVTTGGVYLSDFNRDGCTDVLVTDIDGPRSVFLYAGRPDGTFDDVTRAMGLPDIDVTPHVLWADFDGDGWEDLAFLGVAVFRNDRGRRFIDLTGITTLDEDILFVGLEGITGASVADYDRDGRVDVYVTRGDSTNFTEGSWIDGSSGNPPRDQLLRNLGGGRFQDVTRDANASGGRRSVFTGQWLDANDDGWPDLHLIHEFGAGVLLVNQRDGTFQEHAVAPSGSSDFGSMGQVAGDLNNDGRIDLFVSNMYSKAGNRVMDNIPPGRHGPVVMNRLRQMVAGSQLHLNRGGLDFDQVADEQGVAQVGWSWGTCVADFNNDGWLDIHAMAGFMSHDRNEPDG